MVALSGKSFKRELGSAPRFGLFQTLRDVQIAGLLQSSGFDFVLVDTEHFAINPETLHELVFALKARGLTAIVRLADARRATVQTALESGADGLLAPLCESAAAARAFVNFALYPPAGSRGFHGLTAATDFGGGGTAGDQIRSANEGIFLGVQIETRAGLEHCEEIAAVPGVDLLFLGTGDLSADLGQAGAGDSPELRAALDRVCRSAQSQSIHAGLYSSRAELLEYALTAGVRFLACASDAALLKRAAREERARLAMMAER